MSTQRLGSQSDLFPAIDLAGVPNPAAEPPPEGFIQGIRAELLTTLDTVRAAQALPWPDLTRALLLELRFRSIAGWLPQAEADDLRLRFEAELVRLYAVRDMALSESP